MQFVGKYDKTFIIPILVITFSNSLNGIWYDIYHVNLWLFLKTHLAAFLWDSDKGTFSNQAV